MDSIINYGHNLFKKYISKEDTVIDMTVGNGRDTLFLTKISKFVYGFDIQDQAIINTTRLLSGRENFKLIKDSHYNFDSYVSQFSGAMFNLGYLPGGDKSIHTEALTTLKTVEKVLKKIEINGICVIVFYPGHEGGLEESILVEDYLGKLDQRKFSVLKYQFINQINRPPYLVGIRKLK